MKTKIKMSGLSSLLILMACTLGACDYSKEPMPPVKGQRETPGGSSTGTSYHEKAYDTYRVVDKLYSNVYGLYNENYPKQSGDYDASFLWPYDGLVSGVATLNRLGYDVDYAAKVENYERYYSTQGPNGEPYGAYSSSAGGWGERYYDDNSIVGLNLVEAYRQLENPVYLERCARIVRFLRSGVDNTFGGGLWWCEQMKNNPADKNSNKPACANGFAQWFLLSYYEFCPASEKAEVLGLARELYAWVYNNLRDTDNVYINDKGANGNLHSTKWTYNSGAMIAAGLRLFQITGEQHYLDEAITTADAAYNYFARPRGDIQLSYPLNDPWFTIKLIRAYMELEPEHAPCAQYIQTFTSNLDRAWIHGRQENGLWYEDWSGVSNVERDRGLLMQDAAIESLGAIALYKGEHKTEE